LYSSLESVVHWVETTFELPTATYPQANGQAPFAVVNRTGGSCKYPHDYPRHWVEQQYLPDALQGARYYEWGDNRTEQAAKAYWEGVRGARQEK